MVVYMIEIANILCPVDASEFSQRALDRAFAIARWYGSTVTVLHVITPASEAAITAQYYLGPDPLTPVVLNATELKRITTEVQALVEAERVPEVEVNVLVQEGASVYREVLVQADRLNADLIVMGTHGRSGIERLFLGSAAEKVLRKSWRPVMTVPARVPDAMPRGPLPFTRILCAVDFSASSTHALEYAVTLASEADAVLTLLHVVEVVPHFHEVSPPSAAETAALGADARTRLRAMVPELVRSCCTVEEVVATGNPYREILRLAEGRASDLIVMGVQGRGAADLLPLGSTTPRVVCAATCPVLTLREHDATRTRA
jgi:nucleotide-binding universal stress UspA family protein